ncbi:MAG: patatin-like phospholipase family protein [Actinomycetia bacterium]|nr:patatin-like phospholipase family protein [Actinomycetes bacterium]
MRAPISDWPRPLAYAFSGGGAFGSSHVGMFKALREWGLEPDLVVGTSVGSLNGVIVASNPESGLTLMAELWGAMDRRALFGHGWFRAVRNLMAEGSLSRFDQLETLIDNHLKVSTFDQLPIPFAAVATDPTTGNPEILSSGPVKPALLASAAVPGVFPPVTIEGRTFIDGGISANVPIRQAFDFGAKSVIALDASPLTSPVPPRSLSAGVFQTVSLIVRNQRARAIDDLDRDYPILVLPSVTPADIGSFNFNQTDELVDNAYHSTVAALANQVEAAASATGAATIDSGDSNAQESGAESEVPPR